MFYALLLIYIITQFLDCHSTYHAMDLGAKEGNPFGALLLKLDPNYHKIWHPMWLFKILATAYVTYTLIRYLPDANSFLFCVDIFYALICISNYSILYKLKKENDTAKVYDLKMKECDVILENILSKHS